MKPVPELLEIENFHRCAIQLLDRTTSDEDWDWDSYFLMQHHNAPTRLLGKRRFKAVLISGVV
jgi:hypothetical protein